MISWDEAGMAPTLSMRTSTESSPCDIVIKCDYVGLRGIRRDEAGMVPTLSMRTSTESSPCGCSSEMTAIRWRT